MGNAGGCVSAGGSGGVLSLSGGRGFRGGAVEIRSGVGNGSWGGDVMLGAGESGGDGAQGAGGSVLLEAGHTRGVGSRGGEVTLRGGVSSGSGGVGGGVRVEGGVSSSSWGGSVARSAEQTSGLQSLMR